MSYYVFEGVDGVGKTTTMKAVARRLADLGHDIVLTKEPGGPRALEEEWGTPEDLTSFFGERYAGFRELCVNNPQIPQLVKRALYRADAIYNWLAVVKPALAAGKIVLSDRSWISDLAYGNVLAGIRLSSLYVFNNALTPEMIQHTRCVYLQLNSEERERRLAENIFDEADKIGPVKRDLICGAYEKVFSEFLDQYKLLRFDTAKSQEEVVDDIVRSFLAQ